MKSTILTFLKKNIRIVIGIVIGAILGLVYWYFWGCHGECPTEPPLKSNPYVCAIYGSIVGGLIFESINRKKQ